ncbi:MAG: hypothetical protein K2J15_03485, partial [Muribaculaceae bacterium]|nr:hypothetical protein [Muribaculaceae bacterium]
AAIERNEILAWQPEMARSELVFRTETRGCRCSLEGSGTLPETFAANFGPAIYDFTIPYRQLAELEQDVTEIVKTRELSKTAFVNYKVSSTVLLPDYKSNPRELAAILATIDSVRNDKDLTVNSVLIHGYASPEGSYALNTRLAAGRTEALRAYVDKHYGFGSKLKTASTPEDWAGLREWVAKSTLTNKAGILKVIDSGITPDEKDAKLKSLYPSDYTILLSTVYPTLRRSDYKIAYTVKTFVEPATIAEKLAKEPGKLSMEEIMLLARTYKEGSKESEDLIMVTADLFPTDPRAQLNAAYVALKHGDYDNARRLLGRSDNSPLADYARGLLALNSQDYTTARPLIERGVDAGIDGSKEALAFLNENSKYTNRK